MLRVAVASSWSIPRSAALAACLVLPGYALAQTPDEQTGVDANVHWVGVGRSTVRGAIDYFTDSLNPVSAYEERTAAGQGLGAVLGYRFTPYLRLGVGLDLSWHRSEREGSSLHQVVGRTSVLARVGPAAAGQATLPYVGVALSSGPSRGRLR
jgi:opacity protein-like surface antigen